MASRHLTHAQPPNHGPRRRPCKGLENNPLDPCRRRGCDRRLLHPRRRLVLGSHHGAGILHDRSGIRHDGFERKLQFGEPIFVFGFRPPSFFYARIIVCCGAHRCIRWLLTCTDDMIDERYMNPGAETTSEAMRSGQPRLLGRPAATTLGDHLARYGTLPLSKAASLVAEVRASGLRGRGGAGFPTAVKLESVAANSRRQAPVVVGNATEGEPASVKDKVLLRSAPHLVLDGLISAGVALGAGKAILCIERRDTQSAQSARNAIAERSRWDPIGVEIALTPPRYVAGEETALVSWLNNGDARPTFVPPRPSERGVMGLPTLVDNVETLANIALIARHGAAGYRLAGTYDDPGTALITVRGAVSQPGVYEREFGVPLASLLGDAGLQAATGVLFGGYFGTWVTPHEAEQAAFSRESLRGFGASPGCGLVAVMPAEQCPLQEVSAVLAWLAANSAGQCGPCANGLPAMAGAFAGLEAGDPNGRSANLLDRWSTMIAGRGACKLPDGAIQFVRSATRVFADHIERHRRVGPCRANLSQVLPTPPLGAWR